MKISTYAVVYSIVRRATLLFQFFNEMKSSSIVAVKCVENFVNRSGVLWL